MMVNSSPVPLNKLSEKDELVAEDTLGNKKNGASDRFLQLQYPNYGKNAESNANLARKEKRQVASNQTGVKMDTGMAESPMEAKQGGSALRALSFIMQKIFKQRINGRTKGLLPYKPQEKDNSGTNTAKIKFLYGEIEFGSESIETPNTLQNDQNRNLNIEEPVANQTIKQISQNDEPNMSPESVQSNSTSPNIGEEVIPPANNLTKANDDTQEAFTLSSPIVEPEPASANSTETQTSTSLDLAESFKGYGTFYDSTIGIGSCGDLSNNTDHVAALNRIQFHGVGDSENPASCGRCAFVKSKAEETKMEVKVRFVDVCPGCDIGDIDLSIIAYSEISELDSGRIPIEWRFTDC
ncbi:hypothetical protein AYI68_g5986 [Smittium mucronatum]|uniref:Papain inhibitor n=1 Tax=Smittium mucronatum TaxID=133383 RepID=A0A1R0GSR4_9FUNG|nr:hypothetical protein AYI68_g5986 [Smittium mucronatum]